MMAVADVLDSEEVAAEDTYLRSLQQQFVPLPLCAGMIAWHLAVWDRTAALDISPVI